MGYFKPATLSFNAPRDFFDNVGKNGPVTRVNIELPKELVDFSNKKDDPPYTLQPVEQQTLTEIQSAVLRRYGGVARQFLGAFRQGGALSDLAITNRVAALDQGVGMNYSAHFGREIININVSPEAVRRLMGEMAEALYMLVLYGNNNIAYVPMNAIASPAGNVSKKTLVKSNWSPKAWKSINSITNANRVKLCQVKVSSSFHALSGNLAINVDGVISVPDVSDQTPVFNVKDTLLKSASSSTPWTDYNGNLADKEYVNPIINGAGTDLWNDRGDKFTWTQGGGITRVSTGDTLVKYRYNPIYSYTAVFDSYVLGVLPDGGRFSDIDVNLPYVSAFFWGNGFPITNAQFEILKTDVDAASFIVNYGPGDSEVTYTNSSSSAESFTATLGARVQVYEKTAQGLDRLSMGTCPTTVSYDPGKFGLVPSTADPSATLTNYFGVDDYKMNTSGYEYLMLRFPPALGISQDKIYFYAANYDINPSIGYIQTPYGKYEYTGSASLRWLEGWLHASNGKNVLQGFDLRWGVSKMFLDGVDYGDTLASAVGSSINDINAVILDVKKSDIDKLK